MASARSQGTTGDTPPTENGAAARCRLGERAGIGALQVWRGQHGQVLGVAGSWRLELDGMAGRDRPAGLDDLRAALAEGRPVRFEGPLQDEARSESGNVTTDVRISSIGTYHYLLEPADPRSGTVDVTIVNFRPEDGSLVS